MITVGEIVAQLDEAATDHRFADLGHGYNYLVDSRLHVFRDDRRWALMIEVVGYSPRACNVDDVLHFFGNCLTGGKIGYENEDFLRRIENMDEIEDRGDPEVYRSTGVPIQVRGHRLAVDASAGDELCDVLRLLVPEHRDLLLADDGELRRRLPPDLPRILVLDEWNHPDLFETAPSKTETFQQLAEVLASGDVNRYRPTSPPNTHWSNWPDSGSL